MNDKKMLAATGTDQKLRKKRRSSKGDARKDKIISASIILFSKFDIDTVTVRQISEASDVPLSTIYHYFKDKMSIYDVVIQRSLEYAADEFVVSMDSYMNSKDKIYYIFLFHLQFLCGGRPEVAVIDRALSQRYEVAFWGLVPIFDKTRGMFRELFSAMSKDLPDGVSWVDIGELFVAITYGTARFKGMFSGFARDGYVRDLPSLARLMTDFFVRGFGGTLENSKPAPSSQRTVAT